MILFQIKPLHKITSRFLKIHYLLVTAARVTNRLFSWGCLNKTLYKFLIFLALAT
jgi:hypothetical protein